MYSQDADFSAALLEMLTTPAVPRRTTALGNSLDDLLQQSSRAEPPKTAANAKEETDISRAINMLVAVAPCNLADTTGKLPYANLPQPELVEYPAEWAPWI